MRSNPLQQLGTLGQSLWLDDKWVSDQIGLDEYFAKVLPQDKAAKVREIQSRACWSQ